MQCHFHFPYDGSTPSSKSTTSIMLSRRATMALRRPLVGLSRRNVSMALPPKVGFVKPDGPVCLVILDGVGLGDMQVTHSIPCDCWLLMIGRTLART